MSRTLAFLWSILGVIVGIALLAMLLVTEPPRAADGGLDWVNVTLFIVALMLALGSLGAIVALVLHARWPALAGGRRHAPDPAVGLRQGLLVGLVAGVLALLALFQHFDLAFVVITIVVAGLIEAYLQTRR